MEVRMPTPLGHTSMMASIGATKPALHIARMPQSLGTLQTLDVHSHAEPPCARR
jgi:hypothetical protein